MPNLQFDRCGIPPAALQHFDGTVSGAAHQKLVWLYAGIRFLSLCFIGK